MDAKYKIVITLASKATVCFEGGATEEAALKICMAEFIPYKRCIQLEIFKKDGTLCQVLKRKDGFRFNKLRLVECTQLDLFPDEIPMLKKTVDYGLEYKSNGRIKIPPAGNGAVDRGAGADGVRRAILRTLGKSTDSDRSGEGR